MEVIYVKYDSVMVGQELRNIRIENKLTIQQFSERINMSASHINQIELGSRAMTLNYMCTIMSEFKVDANRILGLEIEKQSSCETIDSKLENLPLKTKKDLIEIFDFMINKARGNLAS